MFIQTEATPNPEVLKFLPGREVLGTGSREMSSAQDAALSPLATALFEIDQVARVFLGPDFLTVTRAEGGDWAFLKAPILAAIMDHYTSGRPVLEAGDTDQTDEPEYDGETAQIVAEIKELLDTRVRPAVAQDGGDIVFSRFEIETGTVYLHMRGACSGCPSSAMTLKAGVENMLRHYVPEVMRVEQTL
ncbi:MAG: NifU family protein [Caulobacter sp.]|jgi:Fe-S cluster biogenesis protein NfuA|nr:NifU family protein [Caulobacter sp.]